MYIVGASGHAKQVIEAFESKNEKILGLYDDNKKGEVLGYKILGKINQIKENSTLFIAIGDNNIRSKLYRSDCKYVNCIHEKAYISKYVEMGIGNYFGPNCTINPNTVVGDFNIFNYNSSVGHDVEIGNFNHFAPSSTLAGNIKIGSYNSLFANSTVIPKITIGNYIILGAGSTLLQNAILPGTYVGSPARILGSTRIVNFSVS